MQAKVKFNIEVGLLNRGAIRQLLQGLKQEILFREPNAIIAINEVKTLLDSVFYITVLKISNELAKNILKWYNIQKKEVER